MQYTMPFNLQQWISTHKEQLKPPVCNKQVFEQDDFIVMVVGGPNNRQDFHYNETPELFYQLEGEMKLRIVKQEQGADPCSLTQAEIIDIPIKAGEIFLLPPKVLHSPQRFEHSIGLVVEQKRAPTQQDALFWFCPKCQHKLYHQAFLLANIEADLPVIFDNFYQSETNCRCQHCGHVSEKS